jgi:hypothetical protein
MLLPDFSNQPTKVPIMASWVQSGLIGADQVKKGQFR